MTGRFFLDTNVLVYAFDRSDPSRQVPAAALLSRALDSDEGVVSIQVLKEFYVVTTRKLARPLSHADAAAILDDLAVMTVVDDTRELLGAALDLCGRERISLWDASIVAAAARAGCTVLYSEDLSAGRTLAGVQIVNPFASGLNSPEVPWAGEVPPGK